MLLPPNLFIGELPKDDQPMGDHVRHQLFFIEAEVARFRAALALIERCTQEEQEEKNKRDNEKKNVLGKGDRWQKVQDEYKERVNMFQAWRNMARRDAIFAVWDFFTTLTNIRDSLDACPSLNILVTRPVLESIVKDCSIAFPMRKEARHAASHSADLHQSPEEITKHSVNGRFFNLVTMPDDTVVFTFRPRGAKEAEMISVKITRETLIQLRSLQARLYACFSEAQEKMSGRMLGRMGLKPPDKS